MSGNPVLLALLCHFLIRQLLTQAIERQTPVVAGTTYLSGRKTIAFLWMGFITIVAMTAWQLSHELKASQSELVGLLILVAGTALRSTAMYALRGFYFTTTTILRQHRVVRAGPYRWLRHPLYLGLVVELAGLALMAGSSIGYALAALMALEIQRVAVREQVLLAIHLGQNYIAFQRDTWDLSDLRLVRLGTDYWARVTTWFEPLTDTKRMKTVVLR